MNVTNPSLPNISGLDTIIVWFRNDLRVHDHPALWTAVRDARQVIPLFILPKSPESVIAFPKFKVILDSLQNLRKELKRIGGTLVVRTGEPRRILNHILTETNASGIYTTRAYAPDDLSLLQSVRPVIERSGKIWKEFAGNEIFEADRILTRQQQTPYTVFTPYYRSWSLLLDEAGAPVSAPRHLLVPGMDEGDIPVLPKQSHSFNLDMIPVGGEMEALKRMKQFLSRWITEYYSKRDVLSMEGTSRLSHHLAIGTISARTLLHEIRNNFTETRKAGLSGDESFIRQLAWRDFYYQIMVNFPHVAESSFHPQYDQIQWQNNEAHFAAWCSGRTGYPIVDATMRQLNSEGWMHNRGRMIVASFLTKDLHIDWRWGEQYFMKKLADGDIALNNGGWQWSAGTGTDAQPWFRIFNPVQQGKRFDPDGSYVRKYIPELSGAPGKYIHEPWRMPESVKQQSNSAEYPSPIVLHETERKVTLGLYQKHRSV